MSKRLPFLLVSALALTMPVFADSSRGDDVDRLQRATVVFQEIMRTPDKGIPKTILNSASCIAIVPGEKKVAFIVGGSYGKGVVTCRDANGWSAPYFITVGGGSFGFQWGATSTDFILVFRGKEGLKRLLSDKFQIGANAAGAAGPVGRAVGASTDIRLHAEILTYSRARGAFAGIDLKGAVVQPDDSGNEAFYGHAVSRQAILNGHEKTPQEARAFLRTIETNAGTRSEAEAQR